MDFLLIIPPLPRLNYPLPELSVRLQVWPHTVRPLHPIKQLDLLTLRLFSNHDMTFQVCQVRAVPALCAALLLRGVEALHYINHSDIVITAVLPRFSMQIHGYISLIYSVVSPLLPRSPLILDLRSFPW